MKDKKAISVGVAYVGRLSASSFDPLVAGTGIKAIRHHR